MVAVAFRVIWDVRDDFVAELFVERLCLKAEGSQEDTVASLHPGFVFGRPEKLRSVPLSAKRLSHPQRLEVEPSSPDVTQGSAEHRVTFVLEENGERAVVGVPGNRYVEESQTIAHKGGIFLIAVRLGAYSEVGHLVLSFRVQRLGL